MNYSKNFDEKDWSKNEEGDYSFEVLAEEHGKGDSPRVKVYQKVDKELFEAVVIETNQDKYGKVILKANSAFAGKAVIS